MAVQRIKIPSISVCNRTGLVYDGGNFGTLYTLEELMEMKASIERGILAISETDVDVEATNKAIMLDVQNQIRGHQKKETFYGEAFCYIAYDSNADCYKIGCSSNVKARAKSLKTANPYLTITHIISGGYDAEAYYHDTLSPYKVRGEWFKLSSDAMKQFIRDWGFKPI